MNRPPSPRSNHNNNKTYRLRRPLSPSRHGWERQRMLFFVTTVICSLSLLASHWAYREVSTTETNHVEHIGPSHLFDPQQPSLGNPRGPLILDLGQPVLQVSADQVQVALTALITPKGIKRNSNVNSKPVAEESDEKNDPANPDDVSEAESSKSNKANDGEAQKKEHHDDNPNPATTVWNQRTDFTANTTFPIMNMGLPRSGEDTLYNFFHNLGFSTQYGCGDMKQPRPGCTTLGICIKRNVGGHLPALEGCSNPEASISNPNPEEFQVYTQLHAERALIVTKPYLMGIILPQVWYLKQMYQYAPYATWILPLHLPRHWAYTLSRHKTLRRKIWSEISVKEHHARVPVTRWSIFRPELLEIQAVDYWEEYYNNHTTRIREFVKLHPTIRLIELDYRRPRAPLDLVASLGVPLPNPDRNVADQWGCMRNECDLWEDNLQMIEHYKTTPRPEIKLPKPIFVVGFPKSGTTSVFNFFSCAGVVSQHYCSSGDVADHLPCYSQVMAECILENKENGRPMLQGCGEYDLYAQLDGERTYYEGGKTPQESKLEDKKAGHFLPQVFELEQIHREYPNATFILPLRDSDDWADSVSRWFNMRHRIVTEYMIMNRSEDVEVDRPLVNIYEKHTQNILRFVQKYPSHKLIKFHITQPDAGHLLAESSGLPESCWGHHNKNTRSRKY